MRLAQITPFVPCADLSKQIAFYRDMLGFDLGFAADNYAFLKRDAAAIRLIAVKGSTDLADPARQGSFYIDCEGLDAVYAAMKQRLDTLPPDRVRAPFDQPYGQREFQVFDEDCTLVFFGEALADA